MKLISAQIHDFRSIEDSSEFEINDLTCLVGKNEAGKTAVLHVLYGTNSDFKYERYRDYPRRHVSKYDEKHGKKDSLVVKAKWRI